MIKMATNFIDDTVKPKNHDSVVMFHNKSGRTMMPSFETNHQIKTQDFINNGK